MLRNWSNEFASERVKNQWEPHCGKTQITIRESNLDSDCKHTRIAVYFDLDALFRAMRLSRVRFKHSVCFALTPRVELAHHVFHTAGMIPDHWIIIPQLCPLPPVQRSKFEPQTEATSLSHDAFFSLSVFAERCAWMRLQRQSTFRSNRISVSPMDISQVSFFYCEI